MNVKRAIRLLSDVAGRFDVSEMLRDEFSRLNSDEEAIYSMGVTLGISRNDLQNGNCPIPDLVYRKYPVFSLLSDWSFMECMWCDEYGPYRVLRAIFGNKANLPEIPSEHEVKQMRAASIRARCDKKVIKINELFPGTYPLELPVWKFSAYTDQLLSFERVRDLSNSFDSVVERYTALFFSAIREELSEQDALEFNLLSTFLCANDAFIPSQRITYSYIQEYRSLLQAEGFQQLSSYIRVHRSIPVWKAREFYNDQDTAIRYIEQHDYAKASIRTFLTSVLSFRCHYIFINNMQEHEYLQTLTEEELLEYEADQLGCQVEDYTHIISDEICIYKENDEISEEDRLIVERGKGLIAASSMGGITSHPHRETYNLHERQMSRIKYRTSNSASKGASVCDTHNASKEGGCDV